MIIEQWSEQNLYTQLVIKRLKRRTFVVFYYSIYTYVYMILRVEQRFKSIAVSFSNFIILHGSTSVFKLHSDNRFPNTKDIPN